MIEQAYEDVVKSKIAELELEHWYNEPGKRCVIAGLRLALSLHRKERLRAAGTLRDDYEDTIDVVTSRHVAEDEGCGEHEGCTITYTYNGLWSEPMSIVHSSAAGVRGHPR